MTITFTHADNNIYFHVAAWHVCGLSLYEGLLTSVFLV